MGQCIFCRQPAGFLRKMHEECRERHKRSISLIPVFFPRFFESDLPVERFQQLLQGAAEASFIKPDEFRTLIKSGVSKMIDTLLEQRLPTRADARRLQQTLDSFTSVTSEDVKPHEMLAKIDVLRELADRKIPDVVTVAGPMPIELRKGETVIWIFNAVTSLQHVNLDDHGGYNIDLAGDKAAYYGLGAFKNLPVPRNEVRDEAAGDIVVTNRNIYFLGFKGNPLRIPIARIVGLRAYAEAIRVICEPVEDRTRTFLVPDSWFAANMLVRMVRLTRR